MKKVQTLALLAAIVQNSDDAIITKDLNGTIISWNTGAERIFGYTEKEVVGKPITIIIPPGLQAEETTILSRLRAGQRIDHFETVRIAKNGARVLVSLTVSPVRNSAGEIVAASKVARDITRTSQVELELKENEQRMRFCLESAKIGTWQWDLQSGDIHWSETMEKIHGRRLGAFEGDFDAFLDVIGVQDRHLVKRAIERALEGDGKYHVEYRQVRSDGSIGWVEASGQVSYDSMNRPSGMMGICRDVSERKRSEAAIREAHEQLETRVAERTAELNRAQERLRMLSGRLLRMQDDERRRIARELHDSAGQILVALNLNLVPVEEELLKTDSALAKQISASLGLVEELSRDLRTMSHLLHPPLLDEAGLISAVRWYVEGFAERSKIEVDLQLEATMCRLPAEFETAVFRIVQESLTNIHRHSGSSSASVVIAREADHVRVEIRDRGKGMPSPISRVGVGIQGMRERVRLLGGQLDIESGPEGTQVVAIFPTKAEVSVVTTEAIDIAS